MTDQVWIVERVRTVEYDCGSQRVVSWHASVDEAREEAARLQAEFDLASKLVWPWHEVGETIFHMLQYESHEKEHGWIACDSDECGYFDKHHQHHVFVTPSEADQALIAQLKDWWHCESRAWQAFVEDEIFARMSDPPTYARELVADDAEVRYEVRAIERGGKAISGSFAAWAHGTRLNSSEMSR